MALARFCRPLLLASGTLLVGGLLLTGLNMLVIGWSVYAIGYIGLMLALLAVAAANRERMDAWSWFGLVVLFVGLVIGLSSVASIWGAYSETGFAGAPMRLPVDAAPLGYAGELITWAGLAFFALAARGAKVLSGPVAWAFVAASVIGLLAAFRALAPMYWVLAILIVALVVLWMGAAMAAHAGAARDAETEAA
ncbi:MAG TPA: hypothetical protein VEX62_05055 [Candidatus Limnocylindrales bacterium]|nr:hypothetical protein [Candidatus Limnocylindrales bacterium]